MSENDDPLSILFDSEISTVKELPLYIIPKLIHDPKHGSKGSSSVVVEKSLDVLKYEIRGPFLIENPCDLKKQRTSGVMESCSSSCTAERLARESPNEHIVIGDFVGVNGGDISSVCITFKVVVIYVCSVPFKFVGKYYFISCAFKSQINSTNTRKQRSYFQ